MKRIKRLLVLQHLEIEGPGLFEQFAKERDLKIEIIRLDNKNALPQTKKGDLILIMEKKIAKKYADLIVQANNSTGRKEALSLIKQATKLKTKLDQYEMM